MEIAGGIGMAIGGVLVGCGIGLGCSAHLAGDWKKYAEELAGRWAHAEAMLHYARKRLHTIDRQRRRAGELGRLAQARKRSEERQRANEAMRDARSRGDA